MVRGTGKFKQKRGGGRNFSKNMVLDENGTAISTDKPRVRRGRGEEEEDIDEEDEEEDEDDEEDEEEEEEEDAGGSSNAANPELSRAERKALKKKQVTEKQQQAGEEEGEEDLDLINPNHVSQKLNISDLGAPKELSRREREQKEKQEAKDRYWKLHLQGKTDQAKADLGRLAKIRADREAALAKRKAEAEAKAADLEAKQKAAAGRRA